MTTEHRTLVRLFQFPKNFCVVINSPRVHWQEGSICQWLLPEEARAGLAPAFWSRLDSSWPPLSALWSVWEQTRLTLKFAISPQWGREGKGNVLQSIWKHKERVWLTERKGSDTDIHTSGKPTCLQALEMLPRKPRTLPALAYSRWSLLD